MKKMLSASALMLTLCLSFTSVFALPSITKNGAVDQNNLYVNGQKVDPNLYNALFTDDETYIKAEVNSDIIDLIKKVNANPSQLATLITDVDLSGYHLLTEIQDLSIYEVSTHKLLPKQKDVTVTWEVPNLVNTLKNVKVLHYSTVRNTWEILTPSKVDFENKSITQHFDDLSPVAVIYKLNDTNKSDADKNKDSKKTGDTTNVVPYVVVGIVALVEVVFFVVKKKKND